MSSVVEDGMTSEPTPSTPARGAAAGSTHALFPNSHYSLIAAAGGGEGPEPAAALERLCGLYWAPLYAFLRGKGESPADAQDLVQSFLSRLVEPDFLRQVDREKGRFRNFLRTALWHYVLNEKRAARAERRGGRQAHLAFGDLGVEEDVLKELAVARTPDECFDHRWASELMTRARRKLEARYVESGRAAEFGALAGWLAAAAGAGDYEALAAERGVTANAIAVEVRRLRSRLLEALRAEVLATVEDPRMVEDELKYVLQVLLTGQR